MSTATKALGCLLAGAWPFFVFGCASSNHASAGTSYVVTVPQASFYKYGPAQNFGADFMLIKGHKVRMVERAFGFSHVITENNVLGYVATGDIKPAPPEPAPAETRLTEANRRPGAIGKRRQSHVEPTPGEALFDVSDLPAAPLPEDPVR